MQSYSPTSAIRAALVLEIVLHVKHLTIYETNVRLHVPVVRRVLFENLMRERCTLAPVLSDFGAPKVSQPTACLRVGQWDTFTHGTRKGSAFNI